MMIIAMVLFSTSTMANDMTKEDWAELYAQAGCNEMGFVSRKICETKVFLPSN